MKLIARHKKIIALISLPLLFLILGSLVFIFWNDLFYLFKSAESLRQWLSTTGQFAPMAFIGLQIIQVIIFIIPGEIVQLAGGFAFGLWDATLYSVLGITLGSVINFYVGRLLGRPFISAFLGKDNIEHVENIVNAKKSKTSGKSIKLGFFLLFVIPGLPKDALTYVAGISRLSFATFLLVSITGRFPGIFASSYIGSSVYDKKYLFAIIISIVAIILFFVGVLFKDKIHGAITKITSK